MKGPTLESLLGNRLAFLVVFLGVTGVLVIGSLWVLSFVYGEVRVVEDVNEQTDALSLLYVNYNPNPDDYISAESYLAMGDYQREFPETQNVQVLTGIPTVEITGYMINYFSAGLGVDCTHCHSLANFAADEWEDETAMANKALARQHLLMTASLNQEWLTQLAGLTEQKQPSGAQIICATCHNGVAQPVTWPPGQASLPDDLRLPLDAEFTVEGEEILNVNGRSDISLDTVQYQQQVMYHMNLSLNVGCTHCHNSRYFPSWEVPAKYYSLHMLQMSQYIWQEWGDVLNGSEPSCNMCHQAAVIPPGAARSTDVLPAALVPPQTDEVALEQQAEQGTN